jgi:hypothetical protein
LSETVEVAVELLAPRGELVERSLFLAVVLAGQHLALTHRLALAAAQLDDPPAREGNDLGPADRLDRPGAVDHLGHRGVAREAHGDDRGLEKVIGGRAERAARSQDR